MKCNEMTRQIQKETKFRFITKHITPFPQKKRPKKQKIEQKNVKKKEWLNAKPKHFLLPLATTTFINALYPFWKDIYKNAQKQKKLLTKNQQKRDKKR